MTLRAKLLPRSLAGGARMKNGLYSVHMQMGDGVKGRASGIIVLRTA
jgi:hypothetical protein